jgi:hypothetical protein
VFLPDTTKTILLADIFFPPLKTEGASPLIHHHISQHLSPLRSQQTSLDYSYTNQGESSDNLLSQWMRENHQEANNVCDNGHESIRRILLADSKD